VLSSNVVTRGTARFGLPQPVSLALSSLKTKAGVITTLPARNTQLKEGGVLLTASGRPVFVLQGTIPAYRDLTPGSSGEDVRQLEESLKRLGLDPGPPDGNYDDATAAAVTQWYKSAGWEPFGPTVEQVAAIRTLEKDLADALKAKAAASAAAAAANLAVEAARATSDYKNKLAAAEAAAKVVARNRQIASSKGPPLAVEAARAKADLANKAAEAEIAAKIWERALVVLDPVQTRTARAAADAKLEVARAAALSTQLEGELAVQTAERDSTVTADQSGVSEAAIKAAQLEGALAVQTALDAQKAAELDAKLADEKSTRIAADLDLAKRRVGVQVPADEIVFISALPVRVEEVTALVGGAASATVMSVTDTQLAIDSSLPLDASPLVKPGMTVAIDEQALGIKAAGVVDTVASTPGTHGVDGYHVHFTVRVTETSSPLERVSLRLTIPIQSTKGAVTAVPLSAISLSADGTSRVQVQEGGRLEYVVVEPGLSANGFVEVTPVGAVLDPGRLVVVGFDNRQNGASP
jgi:peptidoglycan hydrolase-like protein with peptidoglycan-binding domain